MLDFSFLAGDGSCCCFARCFVVDSECVRFEENDGMSTTIMWEHLTPVSLITQSTRRLVTVLSNHQQHYFTVILP
jgi:hypothetical protein